MPDPTFNIYAIGHAHIDPVWQWTKKEGYQEIFATFRSALDRMKEFPSVCFVASSAQFYEWVAEVSPEMFDEIKVHVQEGRWILVGGWWIESDINCCTGESLVRQGLYGQKFFNKHFGKTAQMGFSPDTFGHAWTLPQILKKQEMDSYFYMRPEPHEKNDLPAPLFIWEGSDRTKVLAVPIFTSYTAAAGDIEERLDEYINRFSQMLPDVKDIAVFYGVGNHGGGPTIAVIEKLKELADSRLPGIRFASPEDYINTIRLQEEKLPALRDELQHHARGCYSACADVKMWDRQTSSALIYAEKISSLASVLTDYQYPLESLTISWKKVLFNQFHDILAGTSIEEAYEEAGMDYGYARSVAQDVIMKAMLSLSLKINTLNSEFRLSSPFIVFNPCSWPVGSYVEFETELPDLNSCGVENTAFRNSVSDSFQKDQVLLRDSNGNSIPCQLVGTAAAKQENRPFRIRILFKSEIPAMGYHVYRLDFSKTDDPLRPKGLILTEHTMENSLVRVEFDKKTGAIRSYFDKILNRELFKNPGALPIVLEDWDDTWGHKIKAYDKEIGCFRNPTFKTVENGPERIRLQVKSIWGDSFIVQDFFLYRESSELECKLTVNWHEKYRVLKLRFPTVLDNGKCTYAIPYGFIERDMNGDEEPGQEWIDVSSRDENEGFGFAIINDSKCGYSVKNGDIRLTIFHSTAWCHHNPVVVTEQDACRYMEQGIHEFKYKLIPHSGDWKQANISHQAEKFLLAPLVFHANPHEGVLPNRNGFLSTNLNNVSITVIKRAEEREGLILRCVELYGLSARGKVELKMLNRDIRIDMSPCEIKSLFVPFDQREKVCEVNLLEN